MDVWLTWPFSNLLIKSKIVIYHQPPQSIAQTIEWLHNTLGRPALPECPLECERDCGVPGGKAPASLNQHGKASKVAWAAYQTQLPTPAILKQWFAFTPGIGTLGGGPNQQGHYIGFVDLDHKQQVFPSLAALEARLQQWLTDYPILQQAPRFRTPSGGYRVILAFTQQPDWTAFSLDPSGARMGELLARNGGHTLLPPTIGTNGIAYSWEYFTSYPPVVHHPEQVGIYPTRKSRPTLETPSLEKMDYVPGAIRLDDLISPSAQQTLLNGATKGNRSDAINALAQECYGWEAFCRRHCIPYTGTTIELVQYAWGQMEDSTADPDKWQRILKTINPDTSQTAAEYKSGNEESCWKKIYRLERTIFTKFCPLEIQNRLKAEWGINNTQSESKPQPNQPHSGKNGHSTEPNINPQQLKEVARNLLLQEPSPADLALEIAALERQYRLKNFSSILEKTQLELDQTDDLTEQFKIVHELLAAEASDIDITEFIDVPALANPIQLKAKSLLLPQHWYLFSLLAVVSGLLGAKAYLEIDPGLNFKVPPNLWVGLVLDSGDMKSTITSDIVDPLFSIQDEAHEAFLQAERDYQRDSQMWELLSKDEKKERLNNNELSPTPPQPTDYLTTDWSKEALIDLLAKNNRGLLLHKEEFAGFFKSLNQYRQGKGDDAEFFLSLYDQKPYRSHRVSKGTRHLSRPSASMIGTIQEAVLYEQYGDFSDANGMMARFLWLPASSQLTLYPRHRPQVHFKDVVVNLYQRILNYFPTPTPDDSESESEHKRRRQQKFTLSPEAFDLYVNEWYDYCSVLAYQTPQKGLKAAIRKLQATAARIALNLHCLNALATPGEIPAEQISATTMRKAIALATFCLQKIQLLHTKGAPAVLPGLAPEYLDIIELSKRCGRIKAKTVQRFGSPLLRKLSAEEIRRRFRYLTERDLGTTYNSGRYLEYEYAPSPPRSDRPHSPPSPPDSRNGRNGRKQGATTETTTNQGLQQNGAVVATNDAIFSDSSNEETTFPEPNLLDNATATIATNSCNAQLVSNTDDNNDCDLVATNATNATNDANSSVTKDEDGRNLCDLDATTTATNVESANQNPSEQPPILPKQVSSRQRKVFRVGQKCRYKGSDVLMANTCRGKELEVLEIRTNTDGQPEARVKAKQWACDYWIPFIYLQKIP